MAPHAASASKKTRARWAAGKPDRAVLTSLNVWLWEVCGKAADPKTKGTDANMTEHHPFIRLVNKEADRLVRAFRAVMQETVKELPVRERKAAVDTALRQVAPKIKAALNGG